MLYIILLFLLVVVLIVLKVFPIISGYGAKTICSNVFICNRLPADIIKNDLSSFPLNLGNYTVNMQEKSVTGTVIGLAKKKAVYRNGLGATLINGIDEQELLAQKISIATPPKTNQDPLDWPIGNRIKNTIPAGVDEQQLNAALDEAFSEPGSKRGTRAVVVVHNGEIVAERYAAGFSANSKLAGWSMGKSITSALIGILVKQNKLYINAPAPVAAWKNDERNKITITDLMHMSSGLRWWEYYAAPSDATNMLYKEKNMADFALRKKLKNKPGTKFNYSSGSTNILSYIIRKSIGDTGYYRFPYEELFYKIGMFNTVFEVDASGTFVGSSYCFATARDWARFGLLYLNDGICNGQRILPEGWVKYTATPTKARLSVDESSYGAQWWLNTPSTYNANKKYPFVPDDCFRCQGYEGQYIWVIPSENLVIVRLALEKGNELDPNIFLPSVIKAFSK
ncbi:MAG: serine hydrolase [Segetibacter sp.]|nr:serine hydrolase [Segetibacter sp.]